MRQNYLLAFAVFAVFAVFEAVFTAFALLLLTTTAIFDGRLLAFASIAALALVFVSAAGVGAVSVVVSEVVSKTERLLFSAGIAKSSAESINTEAAAIVIFDKIVCEPRG